MQLRPLMSSLLACPFVLTMACVTHAQAIAPLTHDNHEQHYNDPHPTVPAQGERFMTSRQGAALELPSEDDAFTFVVYGDRTGGPMEGINVLAQAVADTNLIEPDLVMTVGDLVEGYNQTGDWMQQMTQYHEVMDELLCPWFPVAGNHDIYWRGEGRPAGEHEANYEMHFGPLWYAFEHKSSVFIVLYTDEGNPDNDRRDFNRPECQRMSEAQFTWLQQTLAQSADAEHVFVFVHHPRWLGRGYGDDWDRVHAALVQAGNVSGVFGGHIHHMRYDPRDGINYFSLATVGGAQPGHAPVAGWLHHYNIVTVRQGQVAFATLPVGGIMDPRAITGNVSEQSEILGRDMPLEFGDPITINEDGSVNHELTMTLNNPSRLPIDVEVVPASEDSRWAIAPDHRHARIEPGQHIEMSFQITRPAGVFDTTARPIVVTLGIDMLSGRHRFAIPDKRVTVPGSLVLINAPRQ